MFFVIGEIILGVFSLAKNLTYSNNPLQHRSELLLQAVEMNHSARYHETNATLLETA